MARVYSRRARAAERPPVGAVYVGRPTVFGNPFRVTETFSRGNAVIAYRDWIHKPEQAGLRARIREELRGKDLVCWCAPNACHADVILEIANTDGRSD